MRSNYNLFAGQNLERLAAISDGIFAVAMTLLVLDLHVPVINVIHAQEPLWANGAVQTEVTLWNSLVSQTPSLITYFMSFLTLGIFWLGQQTQHNYYDHTNRTLVWIHLAFLLSVTIMPFSTALLSEFITFRIALIIYWINLLSLGAFLYISWRYAQRSGLLKEGVPAEVIAAINRRILIYQAFYTFSAVLCVINTYISIILIVLLQLNSVFAPRIGWLDRF